MLERSDAMFTQDRVVNVYFDGRVTKTVNDRTGILHVGDERDFILDVRRRLRAALEAARDTEPD